ncbi:phosphoesterase, partial [Limnoraphis robusta CCNP1324]|uniref:DUF6851 domain-containing protein n=1 Tax=Limnoraphis robusta TaxID=1118279 RepID=UPI002B37FAC4|nr:phosphoesterase [Limnoraphis robusta CCNP1324]
MNFKHLLSMTYLAATMAGTVLAQTAITEIPLDPAKQSVASLWVSESLLAVSDPAGRGVGPTGASRAYGILGTAMYDAWSAYEPLPVSTVMGDTMQQPLASNTLANKNEAISYAAYTVLSDLFPDAGLNLAFRNQMSSLGFDPDNPSTTAATIGVSMANALLTVRHADGSNQLGGYADTTGYTPANSVGNVVDIAAWTPERVPIDDPGAPIQLALHPHWGNVTPFALSSSGQFQPTAPKSFLLDPNASYDLANQTITRADSTVVPISTTLIGVDINPAFIQQVEDVVAH